MLWYVDIQYPDFLYYLVSGPETHYPDILQVSGVRIFDVIQIPSFTQLPDRGTTVSRIFPMQTRPKLHKITQIKVI